jgi:predicted  nucleic acid-binding Zn-ribbon protein
MTEELVKRLREDARYGYGAACDWSDEERADYWAQQCRKARRNASEAADAIEAQAAEIARLREALRACRRAVSAGRDEPRLNVREIVDEAIEEHDRQNEGRANA